MIIDRLTNNSNFDLYLQFNYSKSLVDKCRDLKSKIGYNNFQYDPNQKVWIFKINFLESVKAEFPLAFIPEEVNQEYSSRMSKLHREKEIITRAKSEAIDIDLPLYDYQKIGVNFALAARKCMINDEMGLGKSLQAIAVIKYLNLNKVLIICPNSIKSNWQREIRQWIDYPSYLVESNGFHNGINIINYEKLLKYSFANEKGKVIIDKVFASFGWELIIIDESHFIKESKSKRTQLALQLTKNAKRVILLTGTPILNRPKELISQLKAIDRMKDFGKDWDFLQKYCNAQQGFWGWDFNGASNLDDLKVKLDDFTIRRLKKDVLKDLPDKFIHSTLLDLPEPKQYDKIEKDVKAEFLSLDDNYKNFYKSLRGLSKEERMYKIVSEHMMDENKKRTAVTLVLIEKLKQEAARQKIIASADILSELVDNKTKTIIFTCHKKTAYDLHRQYPASVVITGDVPQAERMSLIDRFQQDPEVIFFIATMKTAGVGFNLTAASKVIFMELGWTPAEHKQCEDRAWRIGQKNKVDVDYFIMKDTIDEQVVEVLNYKSEVIEGAVEGSLLSKVILNFLAND